VNTAPAAVGDATKILDVDVDKILGTRCSYQFYVGRDALIRSLVTGAHQASFGIWWRVRMRLTVLAETSVLAERRAGPKRSLARASTTPCSRAGLVQVGEDRGRLERSDRPAAASFLNRRT